MEEHQNHEFRPEQNVAINQVEHSENILSSKEVQYDYNVYAGFWIRFIAYITDLGVLLAIEGIVLRPLISFLPDFVGSFPINTIFWSVLFYSYFVLMTKFFGQTLGKMICGIKVIPLKEEQLTWTTVLVRELAGRYISVSLILLYLLAAFTPKKQNLHDIFADTSVIHEETMLRKPAVSLK